MTTLRFLAGFGLLWGCGSDAFTSTGDSGLPNVDAASPADAGNGGDASPGDGAVLGFCAARPTAIYCCDWDTQSKVSDTWSGLVAQVAAPAITTNNPFSPPKAMGVQFVNNGMVSTVNGYAYKDIAMTFTAPHLSFVFRPNGGPGNTIELGALVLHHVAADTRFVIQLTNGNDLHVVAPSLLGGKVCEMGQIPTTPGYHHVDVWVNTATNTLGCKADQLPSATLNNFNLLPVQGTGIQVGVLTTVDGANGDVTFDDVLLDANPPM